MAATPTTPAARDSNEAEPRWLTDEELAVWPLTVGMMTRLPAMLDAQLQRDSDLTFYEYMVMSSLSAEPERTLQMSDLAYLTSASISRLSHVSSRLEKRGYLRRSRCVGGIGRATNLTLTDAGFEALAAAAPGHVRTVRELFIDALTPDDLRALMSIVRRVQPRLDPTGSWPELRPRADEG